MYMLYFFAVPYEIGPDTTTTMKVQALPGYCDAYIFSNVVQFVVDVLLDTIEPLEFEHNFIHVRSDSISEPVLKQFNSMSVVSHSCYTMLM